MIACYMECNSIVKSIVASDATTALPMHGSILLMKKIKQGQHFFREYRERKGISLRKLAASLPTDAKGEPLVSYAQLNRIEHGEQAFTEPVLNAVADALGVHRIMLLEMDPTKDGEMVEMLGKLNAKTRADAIRLWIELIATSAA